MSNEWGQGSTVPETDPETRIARLENRIYELERLDKSNSSAIYNLTEACKKAAEEERSACMKMLRDRASFLRSKASLSNMTIREIQNLDNAAIIMDDAAEMIGSRT